MWCCTMYGEINSAASFQVYTAEYKWDNDNGEIKSYLGRDGSHSVICSLYPTKAGTAERIGLSVFTKSVSTGW